MSFEIYFDESQKIDKRASIYSFYGIIGLEYYKRKQMELYKTESGFRDELHFSEFELGHIDYYLELLSKSLQLINTKIYVVDTEFAFETCEKISISNDSLRKLFYVKIPERLIYGMTRYFNKFTEIDIYIDKSKEYGNDNLEFLNDESRGKLLNIISNEELSNKEKLKKIEIETTNIYNHVQLTKTLKEQLNAQSLYRNLNYKVNSVKQKKSNESICLQISDVILGILGYLFEQKYLDMPPEITKTKMNNIISNKNLTEDEIKFVQKNYKEKKDKFFSTVKQDDLKTSRELREINKKIKIYAAKNIGKSEFIYRALSDIEILKKLHDINIFMWPSQNNKDITCKVDKLFFSHYISEFLNFKRDFDIENKKKILKFHNDSIETSKYEIRDYTRNLDFAQNLNKITERYLKELGINII